MRPETKQALEKTKKDGERLKEFLENVKVNVEGNPGLEPEEIDELLAEAEELAPEV